MSLSALFLCVSAVTLYADRAAAAAVTASPPYKASRYSVMSSVPAETADRFEMLDRAKQVDQRPAEPINGPRHDDIELAAAGILEQGIEAGPLISPLGAADAGIAVDLGQLPAAGLGDLPEFANLALNRLMVCRHPYVERRALYCLRHGRTPVDGRRSIGKRCRGALISGFSTGQFRWGFCMGVARSCLGCLAAKKSGEQ